MPFRDFIIKKLGIDKAIFFTLCGRGLQISTALFTVFFITKFLSPDEQGYYYTFGSIVAIQVFFELGLTGIITQFVAHEASHLKLCADGHFEGEEKYRSRLSSLLRFCAKWYMIIAGLLLVALMIAGVWFFSSYESKSLVEWKLPWALLVVGTAMSLLLSPIISFIEGLGKIKEVAQIRLVQQFINPVVVWGGLALGSKLYVSGVNVIVAVVVAALLIRSKFYTILKSVWKDQKEERVSYVKEIFPYQWRIALSWISGYFIFQLFNPVLFATEGTKVAGQMGMTMAALNALQALTQSWINTKVPMMSGLIAQKKYTELDSLFYKTKRQMMLIGTSALIAFLGVLYIIQTTDWHPFDMHIGDRFLPIIPCALMAWAVFTMFPINCWAAYLRCHKKEPLMWNSVVVALLCGASTLGFGKLYGLYGIVIGFACLRFVSLIWIYIIFRKKRYEWHNQ
jgi:O-antigen/teichoic acid export membrane protein